jgi:hypothetical protein
MRTPINLIAVVLVALGSMAQAPSKKTPNKPVSQGENGYGAVNGRVLAITNGGDLKPGRFVKIYLLFSCKIAGNRVIDSNDETPALMFLKARSEQLEQWNSESKSVLDGLSGSSVEEVSCRHSLLGDDKAILATLEWAASKGAASGVLATDADEEGYFAFKKVRAGQYLAAARGRAGLSDVYWEQHVWVHPGVTAEVKIANVEDSCLRTD